MAIVKRSAERCSSVLSWCLNHMGISTKPQTATIASQMSALMAADVEGGAMPRTRNSPHAARTPQTAAQAS
ncbi:hypothetical protein [Frankia sp. CiP3]|uniref:hypothetical protein n=1 Tax=Frankia sp. CiP3 TaxID=2880971 RepID=UPI001EF6141E|nr:hypothetical protein [Frankia sp. CiP3]